MTEPRRPSRRRASAGPSAVADQPPAEGVDLNPYRDDDAARAAAPAAPPARTSAEAADASSVAAGDGDSPAEPKARRARAPRRTRAAVDAEHGAEPAGDGAAPVAVAAPIAAAPAAAAPAAAAAPIAADDAPRERFEIRERPDVRDTQDMPEARETRAAQDAGPAAEGSGGAQAPPGDAAATEAPEYAPRPFENRAPDGRPPHGRRDGRPTRRERFENRQRQERQERFERQQQQGQAQPPQHGGAPGGPDGAPQGGYQSGYQNGPQGGSQGGPQNGQQPRREFFEGGGRRQRQRQRGRFRDGNGQGGFSPGGQDQPQGGQPGDFQPRQQHAPQQPREQQRDQRTPVPALIADTEVAGWVELARDGSGFVRQAANSYLVGPNDPFLPVSMVRQNNLRAGDGVVVGAGRDFRQRPVTVEVRSVNGAPPLPPGVKRPDFASLLATYPDRKLTLETGVPAGRGGPELTRRIIDLIAPLGFGQRALIVAPARSGKTILLQTIVEGVAKNHPDAELLLLLVDERPEEVSEMVACGFGEVVASSFDMPAERHRDVVTMVMHRAQRLCEVGRDVVIVLDSITRMARAFNATKGIGRTLSGGLDATAMAVPKAFFGSARSVAATHGGGSITIIGTALVETGSRMDDVIFEEFKGTGNCEIKLDRNLAEQRIFPAIDVPASGTRREDKLFRPDQLDAVYLLRRGLQSMPAAAAMNWLTKRIASTPNNDVLLATLRDA